MSFTQFLPVAKQARVAKAITKKFVPPPASTSSFIKEIAPVTKVRSEPPSTARGFSTPPTDTLVPSTKKVTKIDVDTSDILFIDEQVKRFLASKITTIPELLKELDSARWIIENSSDRVDQIQAKKQEEFLRRRIQDIQDGFELGFYVLRSSAILEEYRKIVSTTKSNSFVKTVAALDPSLIYRKNELTLQYMRVCEPYANLEKIKQTIQKPSCAVCHCTKLSVLEDTSFLVCTECGFQIELLDDGPTFKDSERVNMASRYTYSCKGHFIEAMNRFEGKQSTEIGDEVIAILKHEMVLHHLTKKNVTKDHLYMFLSEKELSDYYADLNLIFFIITDKPPPDITDYRSELLEMFDQIEDAYKEVKDEGRLNSLNVNWKLYKLLQIIDFPDIRKDDFFCLKTPAKQGEHEQKWKAMIEHLSKLYPNAVTSHGKKRWRDIQTI
jgi:hypothetical protein